MAGVGFRFAAAGLPILVALASLAACGGTDYPRAADAVVERDAKFIIGDGTAAGDEDDATHGDLPADAPHCQDSTECPSDRPVCNTVQGICVQCLTAVDCGKKGFCIGGLCEAVMCQPNTRLCDQNTAKVCSGDGKKFTDTPCGDKLCYNGQCVVCEPDRVDCSTLNVARKCHHDGLAWDEEACGEDKKCVNGECKFCVPGYKKCEGTQVFGCNEDATDYEFVEDCDTENTGKMCFLGMCIALCELNAKFHTNLGCEYWAVDMDNNDEFGGEDSQYAIVVSNTNDTFTATVRVEKFDALVQTVKAPPKTATIILLDPYNLAGPLKEKKSWRVTSNLPIVAYQFNPLENVGVYSNDASLLLPTNVLGKKYRVMAWPHRPGGAQPLASNFVVVASAKGHTKVHLELTADTLASPDGALPALAAGTSWDTVLEQYEVLNIESAQPFTDLTGSLVDADHPVAVFGGHVCANCPFQFCTGGKCIYDPDAGSCGSSGDCPVIAACDHLEEQLQPLGAWGQDYVVGKTWPRGQSPDWVRIMGAVAGTHVMVTPPITTVPVLGPGQYHDFVTLDSVEITADQPIMVGHYLGSQDSPGSNHSACEDAIFNKTCDGNPLGQSCSTDAECSPNDANIGDPSFMVTVPAEQFRAEYVFLVPTKYALNYVNVVAPSGTSVTLDGAPLAATFTPVGSGKYGLARFPLQSGSHSLSADKAVGVLVYGWDQYVSYGYPGGMNIETLKVWQ